MYADTYRVLYRKWTVQDIQLRLGPDTLQWKVTRCGRESRHSSLCTATMSTLLFIQSEAAASRVAAQLVGLILTGEQTSISPWLWRAVQTVLGAAVSPVWFVMWLPEILPAVQPFSSQSVSADAADQVSLQRGLCFSSPSARGCVWQSTESGSFFPLPFSLSLVKLSKHWAEH